MALLGYQRTQLRQPTASERLNTKHWLYKDLFFIHNGFRPFIAGEPAADVAQTIRGFYRSGTRGQALNGALGWIPNGANNEIFALNKARLTSLPITLSAWWHGASSASLDGILGLRRSGGDGGLYLHRDTSERPVAASVTTAGGASSASVAGVYSSGRWQHGVAVFIASANRIAYGDGGGASSSTIDRAFPGGDCDQVAVAQYRGTSASTIIHAIAMPMVIARALDAEEVRRLYVEQLGNPWALFAERPIWVPVSSGGGYTHPTLSNARMGSLTSTTGVPLVDYTF